MEKSKLSKYSPIDCSNELEMIREGLRVPVLIKPIFDRTSRDIIKKVKKDHSKYMLKNLDAYNTELINFCVYIQECSLKSKLNLTKLIISSS